MALSEEARKAKNKYNKDWARRNPEKVKAAQERYWAKKAREMEESTSEKTCPVCGAPVEGRKKYCSDSCKMKSYRKKHK